MTTAHGRSSPEWTAPKRTSSSNESVTDPGPDTPELKKIGEKVFEIGEVVAMPTGTIHRVWNETDKVTVSLHIYGKHINFTGRSQFDQEKRTETPFILRVDH